jgi:hypothetical protein
MKKAIKTLLLIAMLFTCAHAKAQSRVFRTGNLLSVKESTVKMPFRKFRANEKAFKGFFQHNRKVAPKLSVELLDNKGIHLFSIMNNEFLPDMNVGAKFSAGIIICI